MPKYSAATIDIQKINATNNSTSYPGIYKDEYKFHKIGLTSLSAGLLLSLLTNPTNPCVSFERIERKPVIQNTTCKNLHLSSYVTDSERSVFDDTAPLELKLFKTINVSIKEVKPLLFTPIQDEFNYA